MPGNISHKLRMVALIFFGVVFCVAFFYRNFITNVFATAAVTPATGGSAISADKSGGVFTSLAGPTLLEGASGDIGLGTIILNAPSGFQFATTTNSVTATVTNAGGTCNGNRPLQLNGAASQTVTPAAAAITISVTRATSATCVASITWTGIAVMPASGTPLASGNITNSGTSAINGVSQGATNFGSLSEVPGAAAQLIFSVQPSPTSTVSVDFPTKPAIAVEDQFGNIRTSDSATTITLTPKLSTQTCSGTNGNGTLNSAPASGASVTNGIITYSLMNYSAAESIMICASSAGLTSALSGIITVSSAPDTTPPTVTAFTMPATAASLTVNVASFTATDNVGVTGYLITESSSTPLGSNPNWSATAPATFIFSGSGSRTAYAWAKDAAGNISSSLSANVNITLADTTPPVVTAFIMPSTATSLTVNITSFIATDNVGVTGYLLTITSSTPSAGAGGWTVAAPTSYTFSSDGTQTLYAWAKDAAGNVSTSLNASVAITLPAPIGGGTQAVSSVTTLAGGTSQSSAIFSGQAYPGATISVLRKLVTLPQYEGASIANSIINADGTFQLTLEYFQQADWLFALQVKDKDNRSTRLIPFSQFVQGGSILKIENILIPPTIDLKDLAITKGKNIEAFGYAAPNAKVETYIDSKKMGETQTGNDGRYSISIATDSLAAGNYFIKTRYALAPDKISDFSEAKAFLISGLAYPKADFDNDGSVTVSDWSVFLYRWGSSDKKLRETLDLDGDGKVDIFDFSIFLRAMSIK